jgi:uncharacterized membrane protein YebE (DUF533 family)
MKHTTHQQVATTALPPPYTDACNQKQTNNTKNSHAAGARWICAAAPSRRVRAAASKNAGSTALGSIARPHALLAGVVFLF